MEEEKTIDIQELPQPPAGSVFSLDRVEKISVPHPYCLTPRHVAYAVDKRGGMLGAEAIAGAERDGAVCGIQGCQLPFSKHESFLSLIIKVPSNKDLNAIPGLHAYLLANKAEFVKRGIDGFAFPEI